MKENRKDIIKTIRFSDEQVSLIETYANMISAKSGKLVSFSWVVHNMMHLGQDAFEKEFLEEDV